MYVFILGSYSFLNEPSNPIVDNLKIYVSNRHNQTNESFINITQTEGDTLRLSCRETYGMPIKIYWIKVWLLSVSIAML